jgi:hypothetical protein
MHKGEQQIFLESTSGQWGTKKGVEIALFVLVFLEKDG